MAAAVKAAPHPAQCNMTDSLLGGHRRRCCAGGGFGRPARQSLRRVLLRVRPVPPAAAQRLKQRCGVGEAIGLGLDSGEQGLAVGELGGENDDIGRIAELKLAARSAVTAACSATASYSKARSVSATLRKAVSSVERYCAWACSSAACAA